MQSSSSQSQQDHPCYPSSMRGLGYANFFPKSVGNQTKSSFLSYTASMDKKLFLRDRVSLPRFFRLLSRAAEKLYYMHYR